MKNIYSDYAAYNLWANQRLINFFKKQPHHLIEQKLISSFPSVRLTLLHIWDAEQIWLGRLQGKSMTFFPSQSFDGNIPALYAGLLEQSDNFADFVNNQALSFFESIVYYATTSGEKKQQLAGKMIHHCMNHSTFHRGQLVMMARQLTLKDIPATDYIHYLREG